MSQIVYDQWTDTAGTTQVLTAKRDDLTLGPGSRIRNSCFAPLGDTGRFYVSRIDAETETIDLYRETAPAPEPRTVTCSIVQVFDALTAGQELQIS